MKLTAALSTLVLVLPLVIEAASVPHLESRQFRGLGRNQNRQQNNRFGFGQNRGGAQQNRGAQQNQNQNQNQQNNKNGKNNNNAGGAAAGGAAAGAGAGAAAGAGAGAGAAAGAGAGAGAGAAAGGAANNTANANNNNNAANNTANANNNNNNNNAANNNNNGATNDPNTSLCLDPNVINKGSESDGQETPTAGQVASDTSVNNFINECLGQTLTNGQQLEGGSCNPIPMGQIVPKASMPSAKFVFPKNLDVIQPDKAFTIQLAINNLETGHFTNAQATYFSAPAKLNAQKVLIGHSHVTVEEIGSLTNTKPLDPTVFAFFKGLNAAAQNGILTADVTNGLPAGTYRMCTINSASNHQPALVAIAQHGSLDDCSYFVASNQGVGTNLADVAAAAGQNNNNAANNNNNAAAAAGQNNNNAANNNNNAAAAAAGQNNNNANNNQQAANNNQQAANNTAAAGQNNNQQAANNTAAAGQNNNQQQQQNQNQQGGKNQQQQQQQQQNQQGGKNQQQAGQTQQQQQNQNNNQNQQQAAAGGLKLNGANGGQVNVKNPSLVPAQTAAQTNGRNQQAQQQQQQRGQRFA